MLSQALKANKFNIAFIYQVYRNIWFKGCGLFIGDL